MPWTNDEESKIKEFANRYITGLERQIEAEEKRADEEVMLLKHNFGGDNTTP